MNCGDFIRSRTIKQVLPQIYSFLKLNWKKSLLNQTENASSTNLGVLLSIDNSKSTSPLSTSLSVNMSNSTDFSLNDELVSTAKHSIKRSANAFYYSLDYRLQQMLLEQLGKLAFNIRLGRKDLWPLISALTLYLNDRQPIELRSAAYSSLREIEHLDDYAVYFFRNYSFHS